MSRPLWAWVTLAATLAFVTAPLLTPGFGGYDPEQFPVRQDSPPVQPAGYAFSIWGLIYLWLAVSAVFGVWTRRDAPDWAPMRPALALSVGIGAAWLSVALASPLAATVLIWVMLGTALVALLRAPAHDPWLARHPVGLYAGWLTAASSVSIGLVLAGYGLTGPRVAALIGLALALGIGLLVMARLRDRLAYGAALIWALIAVVVQNIGGDPVIAVLAALAALVFAGRVLLRRNV